MKTLKKIAKVALAIISATAFIAMMAESKDPASQILIVIACGIILTLCNAGLQALGAYDDNND